MVPSNALQRTFRIKYGNNAGTCFTIDWQGKQYIVTARHIVEGIPKSSTVSIFHDNEWKNLKVTLVGVGDTGFDIAVLAPPMQISPTHPLTPTANSLFLGQDVYFLGFPYDLHIEVGPDLNRSFPMPLVKKAIVSAFDFSSGKPGLLLLDGHNNPGFSGGPVIFTEAGTTNFNVAAVISGYRYEWEPVFDQRTETPLEYKYNTGIIVACRTEHAVGLIAANPIGFPLPTDALRN